MHHAKLLWSVVLVVAAPAMNLPHYDLDSLAYMSTDIVTATLSAGSQQQFTAAVTDVLYGSSKSGDRLETLSPFLSFFRPMEDGQRVILFLDRRPRQGDLFNPEASRSPFAVVPSGVYLIDAYEHVHQYYQENNPGLYAAEGYRFFLEKSVPTKEQDLALPTLADATSRIRASLKSVQPLRPLLDKAATRDDATALLDLLDARSRDRKGCGSDAVIDRLGEQLRALNDPEIALQSFSLAPDWRAPIAFVNNGGNPDKDYTAARVKYLLRTLSDVTKNASLRVAAMEILLDVSRFHSGPQVGPSRSLPIDNQWLAGAAGDIQSLAESIFDDGKQDDYLRSLCLRFMPIDQPAIAAVVRQVYSRTRSEELRFAIEDSFLEFSDALYEGLNPPGGPIASVIVAAPERGCIKASADNVAFVEKYREREDFHESGEAGYPRFVLTNLRTGQRFVPKVSQLSGGSSVRSGEMTFEFSQRLDLPVGDYTVAPEFSRNGEVVSTGHKLMVVIGDTPTGRRLSLK
ncbi:MAG: hypothetical protein ABSF54_17990 [Bryobacteraceae bacterium]|jgi:hypothetical protein